MRLSISLLTWLAAVLVILHFHGRNEAAPAPDHKTESPTEKCRRLLEQNISVELDKVTLSQALEELGTRTKLRFHLDELGLEFAEKELEISHKQQDAKAKTVLRAILRPLSLTYIILDDAVVVTSVELAAHRQMQQPIDLDLEEIPLANALKHVAKQTGINLVVDPRLTKEQRGVPVTLQLEEVALETAVRLIAEVGNLGSARVGNVLFVTTPERAEKLRAEPDQSLSLPPLQDERRIILQGRNGGLVPVAPVPPGVPAPGR